MAIPETARTESSDREGATALGLPGFATLRRVHNIPWPVESDELSISKDLFRTLLRMALERVRVDERYYLRTYPDVVEALETKSFMSARHHYLEFGYFEDRLPYPIEVDQEFYFRAYPDVKATVKAGVIPSAQVHFERNGYKEGRLPAEGWSLLEG